MDKKNAYRRGSRISSALAESLKLLSSWENKWPEFEEDETLRISSGRVNEVLSGLLERLKDNYPFFHPCYAGQMLKPQHSVASLAYFLTQQINPNNHALDGGPATAKMELEVIAELAKMFGLDSHLGHLTSSGTIANLEALWVARSLHPQKAIAFSSEAHYTHRRMCDVIGAKCVEISADSHGRMDLDDLRDKFKKEKIGTVVMTAGTTGIGAVDPIDEALRLQREFDFRIHVDAAYGGFFRLLAEVPGVLDEVDRQSYLAIRQADSVVIDPHKHGLQPYGCGSVIFRDPAVGRFYKHDSPYTYFTSKDLHLGEISLECSRAGAAAAAFWATLQCFPLRSDAGFGPILVKTRTAAVTLARLLKESQSFRLVVDPSLDILAFYPQSGDCRASVISELTNRIFESTMRAKKNPVYLAKMNLKPGVLLGNQKLVWDSPTMAVLRSVLMKPEHLAFVPILHKRLVAAAKTLE
jgi:glutamate/tyrosine decarboxylase-like PLP-dependent enzyme